MLRPKVARFYLRAHKLARRSGDPFSALSAARPHELRRLIGLAGGSRVVAEIGTGTAWTAIALALARPGLRVLTYDPIARPERDRYLALVGPSVRDRIVFHEQFGEQGAAEAPRVGMAFIDSSHEQEETVATFKAWEPLVEPGGWVAFHDYGHPDFPGVAEAIQELGLRGQLHGGLYIWRKPG